MSSEDRCPSDCTDGLVQGRYGWEMCRDPWHSPAPVDDEAPAPAEGAERSMFDKWAINHKLGTAWLLEGGHYLALETQAAWEAWQAARASLRDQLAQWMIQHSFATGHGYTFPDLLKELSWQVKERSEQLAQAQTEVEALKGNVKELRQVQRELEEARALVRTVLDGYLAPPGSEFDWEAWAEKAEALARSTGTQEGK